MTILPKGGVLINIHPSLTVRVYNIHALHKLDNRIYVHIRMPIPLLQSVTYVHACHSHFYKSFLSVTYMPLPLL